MNDVKQIVSYLKGNFSNKEQFDHLSDEEKKEFPLAVHRSYVLNEKILNIPTNFKGIYLLEESYYTLDNKERFKSDVFLFELNSEDNVVLSAINVPRKASNKKYAEIEPIDYDDVSVSEKFVPIIYKKNNEKFIGQSESMFTSTNKFILKQEISDENLIIKEEIRKGDKRVFGFDHPIIYKRDKALD